MLFDLDGTLWDASDSCALAWSQALAATGFAAHTVTATQARSFTGLPMGEILDRHFGYVPLANHQPLVDEFNRRESALMRSSGGTLFPDTETVLRTLKAHLKLFVVSNCQAGYIENFFHLTGLGDCFEDFESLGRTGKPKADNIAAIVKAHALHSPVYVGDTSHDAQAAAANQIPFIFAAYGFGEVEAAPLRARAIVDLLPILLERNRGSGNLPENLSMN